MKVFLSFLLIPLLLQPNLASITRALGAGDVGALREYFDQSVELVLLDREASYSKEQAADALRAFFQQHQPQSFSQVHQGASRNNDSQYCIGDLQTSSGTFRVYLYMRVDGSRLIIQELRVDRA